MLVLAPVSLCVYVGERVCVPLHMLDLDSCELPPTPNLILQSEVGDKYFKVILFALCCLVPGAMTIIGIYACLTRGFRTELHRLLLTVCP